MSDSAYCVQDSRWAERSSRKPADCQFVVFDTSFCVRDTRERNRRPLAGIIHKGLRYCVRGWLPEAERFDAVKVTPHTGKITTLNQAWSFDRNGLQDAPGTVPI